MPDMSSCFETVFVMTLDVGHCVPSERKKRSHAVPSWVTSAGMRFAGIIRNQDRVTTSSGLAR